MTRMVNCILLKREAPGLEEDSRARDLRVHRPLGCKCSEAEPEAGQVE